MSQDISGFGLTVRVFADTTFPVGFEVTQFADDADPFDIPSQEIAGTAMGLNGDLVTWDTATPIPLTLNVIPGSEDDIQLSILWNANRVGRGKRGNRDLIRVVGVYPDGRIITLTNGKMTNGMAGRSVASAGRQKSRTYQFLFENGIGI